MLIRERLRAAELAAADGDHVDVGRERGAREQLAVDVGGGEDSPANGIHQRPALTCSLRATVSSVTANSRIAPVTMKITPEV